MSKTKRPLLSSISKMYVNGKFYTSSHLHSILDAKNNVVTKMAHATSADLSKAVSAARSALKGWKSTTPSLRGANIYELAEILELKTDALKKALIDAGVEKEHAEREANLCVERTFWYAGWCDKLPQIYSTVNPVATPLVSVTTVEAAGVVAVFAPEICPLLGLVSALLPVIVAGNTVVVVTHPDASPEAIRPLLEAIHESNIPAGVINILHADHMSLAKAIGSHEEIDAIAIHKDDPKLIQAVRNEACNTLKHMEIYNDIDCEDLHSKRGQSPYRILPFVEFKSTWHPCAPLQSAGSTY